MNCVMCHHFTAKPTGSSQSPNQKVPGVEFTW